jgi:lipopolysaccharide biosynthesis regulator YciM
VLDSDRYHCIECGFRATELHWRCPSCQFWGSVIPL